MALGAILVGAGVTPWSPWLSLPFALLPLLGLAVDLRARQEHYVHFTPIATTLVPAPLPDGHKLWIRATGWFEVEEKHRIHVWLEGYYRTFPTREHAVIALCVPTSLWGLGRSRAEDDGMWYMFIRPEDILQVQIGDLVFGAERLAGVRLVYRTHIPGTFRRKRLRQQDCTTFWGLRTHQEALLVAEDLLYDATDLP